MIGKMIVSLVLAVASISILGGFLGVWGKTVLGLLMLWSSGAFFGLWLEELYQRHRRRKTSPNFLS